LKFKERNFKEIFFQNEEIFDVFILLATIICNVLRNLILNILNNHFFLYKKTVSVFDKILNFFGV